jgi:hypothetical protein
VIGKMVEDHVHLVLVFELTWIVLRLFVLVFIFERCLERLTYGVISYTYTYTYILYYYILLYMYIYIFYYYILYYTLSIFRSLFLLSYSISSFIHPILSLFQSFIPFLLFPIFCHLPFLPLQSYNNHSIRVDTSISLFIYSSDLQDLDLGFVLIWVRSVSVSISIELGSELVISI